MNPWRWVILIGVLVTLSFYAVALWLGRDDSSEEARRSRMRSTGVAVLMCIIPASMFLQDRVDGALEVLAYIAFLLALLAVGLRLFFRGGGWKEFP
jgi:hypothetical protein